METILVNLVFLIILSIFPCLYCVWYRREKKEFSLFIQKKLDEIKHAQEEHPERNLILTQSKDKSKCCCLPIDVFVEILKTSKTRFEFERKLKKRNKQE